MHPQILSWLHDARELTIRYIFVGLAFIPAGLLYAELARRGRSSILSMGLCLVLGFVIANHVWQRSAKAERPEPVPAISRALAAALAGPAQGWPVAVSMAEVHERHQRLFVQAGVYRVAGRHVISVPPMSHEADSQRVPVGAGHAAFCGVSS